MNDFLLTGNLAANFDNFEMFESWLRNQSPFGVRYAYTIEHATSYTTFPLYWSEGRQFWTGEFHLASLYDSFLVAKAISADLPEAPHRVRLIRYGYERDL